MIRALINARVLEDGGLVEGRAVVIENGRIKGVVAAREIPADARRTDLEGALLLPGFFDTQVNGGAGLLFNDSPSVETIAAIGAAHRRFGTTGFLPTLISDDLDVVREAIAAVDAAIAQGVPGVWGIHIEGPFLNVRRKGVHDASKFLTLDEGSLGLLASLKHGRTLVTLAPEKTRPDIVRKLRDCGVTVAAGHTNASYAATKAALEHGLTGFTHLFNAMSPLTSREPGVVGAALENQTAWCGLIVDGRHVDPVVLKIALKCRPLDRFMLVTDAMPSVGMSGGKTFMLQGRMITVEDGVCVDAHGTLAGSDLDMASAVRNARNMLNLDLPAAVRMASAHPAAFIGLDREIGRIAPGLRADLVAADDDLKVLGTWIAGEPLGLDEDHAVPARTPAFGAPPAAQRSDLMSPAPTSAGAMVIFGATGDLALRMLYPSLYFLELDGLLPTALSIVGASRSPLSDAAFADRVEAAVRERAGKDFSDEVFEGFRKRLKYLGGDASQPEMYLRLSHAVENAGEVIFYLSTSPSLYGAIAQNLERCGLAASPNRIVVEKPLGRDLASCRAINDALGAAFSEDRIFRIDHYLGKEAVQNLLALRFANTFFEPLWNKVSIDHVQITVAETVGVEGRWGYYDEYGAIRDMVQNHMMQLLCLVAMEPPASLDPDSVRNEKVKVLRSLRTINGHEVDRKTVRGQYRAGVAEGHSVPGYADEADGKASDTETFVALCAHVDNWRWAGVPFYLRTGKRMPERSSQIVIQFREVPHSVFGAAELLANRLTIRLQPQEDISLLLMNKAPTLEEEGRGMDLKPLALNLSLSDAFPARRRIAYERLLLEAIKNDTTLFVRRDEAEAAWAWIDAVVHGWQKTGMKPNPYPAGSWGPAGAFALVERDGRSWYE